MSKPAVGMLPQSPQERQAFEAEARRIVQASQQANLSLRLLGSLAFQWHCPQFGYLQAEMGRAYTDIDFAAYGKQAKAIRQLMTELGYQEEREVYVVSEGNRAIFSNGTGQLHVDVFYDRLDFSHVIPWKARLEADAPTIPLAEMLLEKMQIFQINEKDIIDTIMLLLEHDLGGHDRETINLDRVAGLCAVDWGLWRTVTMNLEKVQTLAQGYQELSQEHKDRVAAQVQAILQRLAEEPKSLAWKLRARVGDRVKWYKDVDEVS